MNSVVAQSFNEKKRQPLGYRKVSYIRGSKPRVRRMNAGAQGYSLSGRTVRNPDLGAVDVFRSLTRQ